MAQDQAGRTPEIPAAKLTGRAARLAGGPGRHPSDRYKWIALTNTTSGVLLVTIDSTIVIIAMPAIFRGIGLDPLEPGNSFYLLWMMLGYLITTSVLVVSLGRMGDMFGRVRMYNLGFLIFAIASIMLSVDWLKGGAGAMWLIGFRIVQGVGGANISANSGAILTDAFPANQRGMALGLNNTASIAGRFLGLVVGGLLATIDWRLVFFVSVPFSVFGTVWGYFRLEERGTRNPAPIDWLGNVTFGVGLILVMIAITYGIQPYGGHVMGWTSPRVLTELGVGFALLCAFLVVERRVPYPMFRLELLRIRAFTFGTLSSFLSALARGGLMFMLIIWLQGIWLPRHGYSFTSTPLWAGIYMLPLSIGVVLAGPVSGILSDRFGSRPFATGGMLMQALAFVLLQVLPTDFPYPAFAAILLLSGLGSGTFASPNRAGVMNSLPPEHRGAGSGMNTTFQNSAQVLSIGVFFTLMIIGLSVGAAADPQCWAARPGCPPGRGRPRRPLAAGVGAVRRVPGLQPAPAPAGQLRAGFAAAVGGSEAHQRVLLPVADLGPVPGRAARGLHLRPDLLSRRRRRLVVEGQAVRARAHQRGHARPAGGRC